MDIKQEYKDKIIAILAIFFPDAKIILFGSRARKTHQRGSDIDIAIDTGSPIRPFSRLGEAKAAVQALYIPYGIDVVDLHGVSKDMQEMILQEGIPWKK